MGIGIQRRHKGVTNDQKSTKLHCGVNSIDPTHRNNLLYGWRTSTLGGKMEIKIIKQMEPSQLATMFFNLELPTSMEELKKAFRREAKKESLRHVRSECN